ncbi:MAG: UDP-N-acetylglucosamine 2-epimerase (non-hydrolyzing) [Brevundimonas sp.]|uniref:non-hydrolyzing UDP-N-acetylglucosamine 2-epimerase n=1 Tax=Brevundimonas sp. TaxID=1871086 RepID=UPI0025BD4AF1|nr:UDP-N-acetylglucosamine 2-epimerase (non-hydrolyzing) [Brevundimonas sp.]MBX3478114.1 UDP-N-acetylglucosamine 2-epimerase (non-hydrolyzing) [Brevundimonas sp.]
MRIALVAGTRPEVIKLAPLHAALAAHRRFQPVWISTEQQGELNARALEDLGIRPDVRLAPPSPERSVGGRFAQIMDRLDEAFARIEPDLVLVQGDTSSTGAGAMAGFARRIPVGHVEAGLRTFDLDRPFPEEAWRCVVGQLAMVHFAPTQAAARNLARAGVPADRIHITGNTGIDSARIAGDGVTPEPLAPGLRRILVTLHRRENWETGLEGVLRALVAVRDALDDIEIVFVAHANPMLRTRVDAYLAGQPRIRITDPLDYPAFLAQLKSASLVLSDSGGVQEEAPVFGAPVLVLRESTERMEAVEAGVARLVGVDPDAIVRETLALMSNEPLRMEMVRAVSPFGDGHAATRIADILETVLLPARDAATIRAAV